MAERYLTITLRERDETMGWGLPDACATTRWRDAKVVAL
jgi:hypothetical protein